MVLLWSVGGCAIVTRCLFCVLRYVLNCVSLLPAVPAIVVVVVAIVIVLVGVVGLGAVVLLTTIEQTSKQPLPQ